MMELHHSVTQCEKLAISHQKILLQRVLNFKKENLLTDVTIICNGKEFLAHRLILVAGSSYFKRILLENPEYSQDHVEMNNIDITIMEIIIEFLYTGHLPVDLLNENYFKFSQLFSASSALGMNELYNYCRSIACNRMDNKNFLDFWERSQKYDDESLLGSVISYVNKNFSEITNTEEFFNLSPLQLKSVLSCKADQKISSDDALNGIINWISHDFDERTSCFNDLISAIDQSALSYNYLKSLTDNDSLVFTNDDILRTLNEIKSQKDPLKEEHLEKMALSSLPQMNEERKNFILNTEIYHFGLSSSNVAFYRCFQIQNGWQNTVNLPFLMADGCAIARLGHHFYFAGGKDNDCKPTVRVIKYNQIENNALFIEPLIRPVWDAAVGVILGKIYILGGKNLINRSILITDCVQCYDPSNASWSEITSWRVYRSLACAITMNDNMYIAGGYEYTDGSPCQRILHHTPSNPHVNIITIPEPVQNINESTAVCLDKIYVVRDAHQKAFLIYDPTTKGWTAKTFPGGPKKIERIKTYIHKDDLFPYILVIGKDGEIFLLHPTTGIWHLLRSDYFKHLESEETMQTLVTTGSN